MGSRLDRDKTFCDNCGSNKTYVDRHGWVAWRMVDGKRFCMKCYAKTPKHKEDRKPWDMISRENSRIKRKLNRFYYKGKRLWSDSIVRTGQCKRCGRIGGLTHLHHEEYDDENPLAHTMELCPRCHRERSVELGQFHGHTNN